MSNATFNIGDRDYEVEISYASGDGEVNLEPFVTVSGADAGDEVVTLETFVTEWALYQGVDLRRAREQIEERAWERAIESQWEDYYDQQASYREAHL